MVLIPPNDRAPAKVPSPYARRLYLGTTCIACREAKVRTEHHCHPGQLSPTLVLALATNWTRAPFSLAPGEVRQAFPLRSLCPSRYPLRPAAAQPSRSPSTIANLF